jgi:hypothetical protein
LRFWLENAVIYEFGYCGILKSGFQLGVFSRGICKNTELICSNPYRAANFTIYGLFENLFRARRMEIMDGDVNSNLQKQINSLEKRLRWKRIVLPLVTLFFSALLEILPVYQHFRMLDKWHTILPLSRVGIYAGFLVLQFFTNRWITRIKFGNHLDYLKNLLKEME